MPHYLNASELATVCKTLGLTEYQFALEVATQAAADAVAKRLGVIVVERAETLPGVADLCVGFGPATPDQPVPTPLDWFDMQSAWMEGLPDDVG